MKMEYHSKQDEKHEGYKVLSLHFHQQFRSCLSAPLILVKGLKEITGFYFSYRVFMVGF